MSDLTAAAERILAGRESEEFLMSDARMLARSIASLESEIAAIDRAMESWVPIYDSLVAGKTPRRRSRLEQVTWLTQQAEALIHAPENAFTELVKQGIEFYEIDDDGEPCGDPRKIVYCEDKGDRSVGIDPWAWWQVEKPAAVTAP